MGDNLSNMVHGTCDGTGAVINVILGFIPSYVKVFNMEDAGNKVPEVEWHREFQFVAAQDEGIKTVGVSDTDIDRTVLTADGISEYAGGDVLIYDGATNNRWELKSDDSDATEVYVNGRYKKEASGDNDFQNYADHIIGDNPRDGMEITTAEGFKIGADSDINADGEQLAWIAYK